MPYIMWSLNHWRLLPTRKSTRLQVEKLLLGHMYRTRWHCYQKKKNQTLQYYIIPFPNGASHQSIFLLFFFFLMLIFVSTKMMIIASSPQGYQYAITKYKFSTVLHCNVSLVVSSIFSSFLLKLIIPFIRNHEDKSRDVNLSIILQSY